MGKVVFCRADRGSLGPGVAPLFISFGGGLIFDI